MSYEFSFHFLPFFLAVHTFFININSFTNFLRTFSKKFSSLFRFLLSGDTEERERIIIFFAFSSEQKRGEGRKEGSREGQEKTFSVGS